MPRLWRHDRDAPHLLTRRSFLFLAGAAAVAPYTHPSYWRGRLTYFEDDQDRLFVTKHSGEFGRHFAAQVVPDQDCFTGRAIEFRLAMCRAGYPIENGTGIAVRIAVMREMGIVFPNMRMWNAMAVMRHALAVRGPKAVTTATAP